MDYRQFWNLHWFKSLLQQAAQATGRKTILDYLSQVKNSLLDNPESGITISIHQLQDHILKSIQLANH